MIIIQDSQEKIPFNFSFYDDVEVVTRKIETGDYTLDNTDKLISIERKRTSGELSINLGKEKKRFDREMERLSEYKFKYILTEFSHDILMQYPKHSGIPNKLLDKIKMNPRYMLKCLEEYQSKYDITVIYCNDTEHATEIAYQLLLEAYQWQNSQK